MQCAASAKRVTAILGAAFLLSGATAAEPRGPVVVDQKLYGEVKDEVQRLVDPLFPLAMLGLEKRGSFLPFGSVLSKDATVKLVSPSDGKDVTTSAELLPILHDALRGAGREGARAVAACEWVTIEPQGQRKTKAIKALVEHSRGLTIAFYLPVKKPFLRKWEAGVMFVQPASVEINAWAR